MTREEIKREKIIRKAIIEDKYLLELYAQKERIYFIATPQAILKDGKIKTFWIDETNNPLLSKINEMIEARINQIKKFYSQV